MTEPKFCPRQLRLKTSNISPPIPIREFDWVAWIDGEEEEEEEEDRHRGHGRTEEAAILDLIATTIEYDDSYDWTGVDPMNYTDKLLTVDLLYPIPEDLKDRHAELKLWICGPVTEDTKFPESLGLLSEMILIERIARLESELASANEVIQSQDSML